MALDLTEKRLDGETVFNGRVFRVERDRVCLPDGTEGLREVVRHPGGVAILAVDDDGQIVLVRQYRYAVARETLEIPAGRLEPGEDPQAAAERELSEETGFRAARVSSLGEIIPTGGYDSEIVYLYLARELSPGPTHPDEGEFVVTERLSFDEATARAARGDIRDAKTIAALLRAAPLLGRSGSPAGETGGHHG